jgi:hypothetical protein
MQPAASANLMQPAAVHKLSVEGEGQTFSPDKDQE